MFLVFFVERGMVTVICFGNVHSSPFSMSGNCLSLHILFPLIAVNGLVVYSDMVGCLVSKVLIQGIPGLSLLVIWPLFTLRGALVRILLISVVLGLLLIIGMPMILPWRCLITLMSGLMVEERISLVVVVLRLLVLVFICLLLSWRFDGVVWEKSMAMLVWSVAVLFCLFLVSCRLSSVLNFGVPFLLCRRTGLAI